MLPYSDDTESYSPPTWIFLLIIANAAAFIISYSAGAEHYVQTIFAYGTIPARFFPGGTLTTGYAEYLSKYMAAANIDPSTWAPPFTTLFTSMFLHGGILHLIGNMWFLWLFGDNVEDRLGKLIFPIFYVGCGLVAGLAHVVVEHNSQMPAIGASGAIAGVMGAYIYMFPRSTVRTLVSFRYYFSTIYVPAWIFIGLWLLLQFFGGLVDTGNNVAFMAHIGGFIGGLSLAVIFDRIKLITWYPGDRNYAGPEFVEHPTHAMQGTVYRGPIGSGPTYTGDVDSHGVTPFQHTPPQPRGQRVKTRYVWKE